MLKVGLNLLNHFYDGELLGERIKAMVEQVRVARDAGFASLWTGQHFLMGAVNYLQPIPLLARLIPEAAGMQVGPCVLLLPLYNPVQVAEESAALDHLTGGRYVLGIGLGYRESEQFAFGTTMAERVARSVESIAVVRRLWTEESVTHEGRFWRLKDAGANPKPMQKPGPPIWMGAVVEAAIRRAARIADNWFILVTPTVAELGAQIPLYHAALAEVGKPVPAELPILREVHVAKRHASALDECSGPLAKKYESYTRLGLGDTAGAAMSFADFARDRFIIGDGAFVRDEIQRYAALGCTHFVLRLQWPGLDQDAALHSIRALGRIFASL
ncbi:MAG: LLM class flavin-dependent oxidoreductase [Alphaproteobacteria bacterium]|nr:LLM class flavin-dependent oxidoreductase [Alphaproteobacteria bacterium]